MLTTFLLNLCCANSLAAVGSKMLVYGTSNNYNYEGCCYITGSVCTVKLELRMLIRAGLNLSGKDGV
jgi:hypothetical protein